MLRSLMLVIVFPVALLAGAQDGGYGRLQGGVQDSATGEPIEAAMIRLLDEQRAVYTDADGFFRIEPIAAGPHDLVVLLLGYVTDTVRAIRVDAGRTAFVRVELAQGPVEDVHLPGPIYESENGWQRFWRRLAGRPRRIIGPG